MYDRRREAGQLVLVAAISIAFIVLGLVVVFNGVLYTQTVSASGTSAAVADAKTTELEIEEGLEDLLESTDSPTDDDVRAFTDAYTNATANERPVVVTFDDIDVDNTNDEISVDYTYTSREVSVSGTIVAESD